MSCLRPLSIKNPKYANSDMTAYKEWPLDYNLLVPCGSCVECNKSSRSEWMVRLILEMQHVARSGGVTYFCTFTLAPERYEEFTADIHRPIRLFFENYRRKFGKSCKHFFVSELGKVTERLHYHGFLFNPLCDPEGINDLWIYGFTNIKPAVYDHAHYVTKYILKPQLDVDWYKPRRFISAGIGRAYVDQFGNLDGVRSHKVNVNGRTYRLPRYLRRKLYSQEYLRSLSYDMMHTPLTRQEFQDRLVLSGVRYDSVDSLLDARARKLEDSIKRGMSDLLPPPKDYLGELSPDCEAFDDFCPF